MKEEFDFNTVGKRMPYKVPAGSLETATEQTLAAVNQPAVGKPRPLTVFWRASLAAASVAALLLLGYVLYPDRAGSRQQNPTIARADHPPVNTTDSPKQDEPAPAAMPHPAPQTAPLAAAETASPEKQGPHTRRPETLEELLNSITDEDLLQLTAMAQAEEYVLEQTTFE